MLAIVIVVLFLIGVIMAIIFLRKKSSCSCFGKICKSDQDCLGSGCCDTDSCVDGKCCSTDCKGKSCSESNTCGQSCSSLVCGSGEVCFENNCCEPSCVSNSCSDNGCGGQCECKDGYKCVTDDAGVKSCCKPPDCRSGFCGSTACGSCKCVDEYCDPSEGCCVFGECSYKDICHTNAFFGKILGNSWAKFCNTCSSPSDHCDLILPEFHDGSFIPKSGTIRCTSCQDKNVADVDIDSSASYYDYNTSLNKIVPNYIGNYCKDSLGKCNGTCVCMRDDDCVVYGCSTCTGGFCY